MFRCFRAGLYLTAAIPAAAATMQYADARVGSRGTLPFDIPAQPLEDTVRELALASGQTILVDSALVNGKQAPALNGTYTLEAALRAALQGSDLKAQKTSGGYVLSLAATNFRSKADEDIVVTGSRLAGENITAPVIRIGQEEMRSAGFASLGDLVRYIPQNFGGGQNPGIGLNVPLASGGDVGAGASLNLRGLGSDATLTLLNGHRQVYAAAFQSVDISVIPMIAVDRVEIIADGASALYGSDAVAGVANILLRNGFDGIETSARLGGATDGGYFQQNYSAIAGRDWGSGAAFIAYEYGSNTTIEAHQRSYAKDRSPGLDLFPALRHHSIMANGHQDLGGGLTFALDGLYNVRWSDAIYPLFSSGDLNEGRYTFSSVDKSLGLSPSLTFEASSGWKFELAGTWGREKVSFHQIECYADDCTNYGNNFYRNTAWSVEANGTGSLFTLPGGPARLAIGAGYRKIGYERFAGVGSLANADASQDNLYAFGELGLPLIGADQNIPFVHKLNGVLALRYERYPGIDNVATPRLGLSWEMTPDFGIKAGWGKSFRAPTLYQKYQPSSAYLYSAGRYGASGASADASVLYVVGGSDNLKPERATSWTATLDLHPRSIPGLKLEVSYFNVDYRNRIVAPISTSTQALSSTFYQDQVLWNPDSSAQASVIAGTDAFFNYYGDYDPANVVAIINNRDVNAGRQLIHGVDIQSRYDMSVAEGETLSFSFNLAYMKSKRQLSADQPEVTLAGTIFNPPHWRGQASAGWTSGPVHLAVNAGYTGSVWDNRYSPSVKLSPMTTIDLTAGYVVEDGPSLMRGTEFGLTVQNLFNDKPTSIVINYPSDTPYDSTNYSPIGRTIAVEVRRKW